MKRTILFICMAILAFAFSNTINSYAESRLSWENNKALEVNRYQSVAYGNDMYVAVGDDGAISTSLDAKKWKTLPFQTTNGLKHVIWDGSKFVIVGDKGIVMTSQDGLKWELNQANVLTDFSYIIWAKDKYIAIANKKNELMESNDGLTWKSCVVDSSFTFGKIVYNGEFYVAIGGDPFYSTSYIYLSKDGTSWVRHCVGQFGKFTDIIFDNGVAIASANYVNQPNESYRIITSSDCVTWKEVSKAPMLITCLCKMNDTFIYSMYNKLFTSKDLITWTELNTSIGYEYIDRFFKCNNKVFAIPNYSNNVLASDNGNSWEYSISADILPFNNVQWIKDHFIILSSGIYTSQDGVEWKEEQDINLSFAAFDNYEVAYNGLQYIKVDFLGNIYHSKDSNNWIGKKIGDNVLFTGVVWEGNRFLAFGSEYDGKNAIIYSSPDGNTWEKMITNTNNQIESIAWNGMTYVAVGINGTIITFIPTDIIKVRLNNIPIIFDLPPKIKEGRTLVPVRAIFEALGANVTWNSDTKTIIAQKNTTTITLVIDSNIADVNGKKVILDAPATIIGERTMVPLRFIGESLSCQINWNSQLQVIDVTY